MPTTAAPPILKSSAPAALTRHAREQMRLRGLSEEALELTLAFGRIVWTRGAQIFAIGRREVRRFAQEGVDLSRYEGVQVVCTSAGTILTAYRNRDFRGLRPALGRGRARPVRSPRRPRNT
ncbi:MAG TPA: DUF4258 domain-containing protein [Archangium sp.]|nr:DUF4258 domain-containing protein [Archangium sp.]